MTAPSPDAVAAVLDFVTSYIADHGYAPSAREIQEGLDLASLATVHRRLRALQRAGAIDWTPRVARTIRVLG